MSERGGDDAVRVPIEIKTDDLEEIQQLIQELTEAGEEIRKAKTEEKGALPRKGRARDENSSWSRPTRESRNGQNRSEAQ